MKLLATLAVLVVGCAAAVRISRFTALIRREALSVSALNGDVLRYCADLGVQSGTKATGKEYKGCQAGNSGKPCKVCGNGDPELHPLDCQEGALTAAIAVALAAWIWLAV